MVQIGFDDRPQEIEETQVSKSDIEKLEKKKNEVVIPERYIPEIMQNYDCVCVLDYGDGYHMSDEEREKQNENYKIFNVLSKCKHKYRKLDQYIDATREALKCLDFVAENNGVFDPEEFKKKVLKGKLYVTGLFFPKFIGKEKKYLSMDYLTDFILSDEPSENIIESTVEPVYTEEDKEKLLNDLFTEEEIERFTKDISEDDEILMNSVFSDDDRSDKNVAVAFKKKEVKYLIKNQPEFVRYLKKIKDKGRSLDNLSRYAYDLTRDDLDMIEKYDREHNLILTGKMPKFKGDILNDDDYNRYLLELEDWESENVYDNYHGKSKSLGEIESLELKRVLEENNWNIRALYENKEKEKKLKRIAKQEKQKEKELRKALMDIDRRRKRRMGEEIIDSKKKKKHKVKKK